MTTESDLRRAYAALLRRRVMSNTPPPADVDEVRVLAERPPKNARDMERLDEILAHPETRDEYVLLRTLARDVAPRQRGLTAWLPIAAVLLLVAGVSTLWKPRRSAPAVVMRGATDTAFRVMAPAPGDSVMSARSLRLAWRALADADYVVELLDGDARVVWSATTRDTAAVVPVSAIRSPGTRYTLQIVARTPDGVVRRAAPRPLIAPR